MPRVPLPREVFPSRVLCFDQRNLLLTQPSFDCFLAGYGMTHILEPLEVYKTMDSIFAGEARQSVVLVLPDSVTDVIRDADVENSGLAGHDVDVIIVHWPAGPSLRSG